MNYYVLTNKVKKNTAFAFAESDTLLASNLVPCLKDKDEFPFDLVLKKSVFSKGRWMSSDDTSDLLYVWMDFLQNDLAFPFMSMEMKKIVESNLTGYEGVIWMRINVRHGSECRFYYMPRFEKKLDVINENKTTYVESSGLILKPVFSLLKVSKFSIFYKPQTFWEMPHVIYVNEKIQKAIQKAKLSGVGFESTRVE